jgi:hypothetical protein
LEQWERTSDLGNLVELQDVGKITRIYKLIFSTWQPDPVVCCDVIRKNGNWVPL